MSKTKIAVSCMMIALFAWVSFCPTIFSRSQNISKQCNESFTDAPLAGNVSIDAYTQKGGEGPNAICGAFSPQDAVSFTALVANDEDPVENETVAFSIRGPANLFNNITAWAGAVTNASGIASVDFTIPWPDVHAEEICFGTWNVSAEATVGGSVIADTVTFKVGWIVEIIALETGILVNGKYWVPVTIFTKSEKSEPVEPPFLETAALYTGDIFHAKITIRNIDFTPKSGCLTVTCCDAGGIPFCSSVANFSIPEEATRDFFVQDLYIPEWALLGAATAYGNALDALPWEEGKCYCPEETAGFEIILEGSGSAPPSITEINHTPEAPDVGQEVVVSARIADAGSGVKEAFVFYHTDANDTWVRVKMSPNSSVMEGIIPGLSSETNVSFAVVACDDFGQIGVNDNAGQYYVYTIIPEFTSTTTLMLLMFVSFTVSLTVRDKIRHHQSPFG